MCAVAHFIEDEGVPTVTIALVREHAVGMRPPRALWVPFPLGRPFGAPNNAGLQARVLRAALGLFDRAKRHGYLEDFPEDAPPAAPEDMDGMVCPVPLPRAPDRGSSGHISTVAAEAALLAPLAALALERQGRTTFGVSGLELPDGIAFLAGLADGQTVAAAPGLSLAQTLRFASEDLKSWYIEAASARPGQAPSSASLADWFWGETAAGAMLLALNRALAGHPDVDLRAVAQRALVPRTQAHRISDGS